MQTKDSLGEKNEFNIIFPVWELGLNSTHFRMMISFMRNEATENLAGASATSTKTFIKQTHAHMDFVKNPFVQRVFRSWNIGESLVWSQIGGYRGSECGISLTVRTLFGNMNVYGHALIASLSSGE